MKRGLVLLVILFSLSFVSAVSNPDVFGHKMTEIAWGDGSTCSSGVITGISSSGTAACGPFLGNSLAALDGTPAQAVYVDNDGNVGIGMTAPDVPLSVAGNVRALNFIGPEDIQFGIYTNKDYSSGAAIQFYGINGDIPNSMHFMTGSTLTERVRIDSDGNVGIGTTDPGAYKLNVVGNTKITGNLEVTGAISGGGVRIWQNVGLSDTADSQTHSTSCDSGYLMSGLRVFGSASMDGFMTAHCTKGSLSISGSNIKGPLGNLDNQFHNLNCDNDQVIRSVSVYASNCFDYNLQLDCGTLVGATLDDTNIVWANNYYGGANNDLYSSQLNGVSDNKFLIVDCPSGYVAAGIRAYASNYIENFDILCKKLI